MQKFSQKVNYAQIHLSLLLAAFAAAVCLFFTIAVYSQRLTNVISVFFIICTIIICLVSLFIFLFFRTTFENFANHVISIASSHSDLLLSLFLISSILLGTMAYTRFRFLSEHIIDHLPPPFFALILATFISVIAVSYIIFLKVTQVWHKHEFSEKANYWLRAGAIAALPFLVTCILVAIFYKVTPFSFLPFTGDELFYWHETKTFSAVGFSGGYYAAYEKPPLAGFTHFGPHGFVFPMIYGTLGALAGWTNISGLFLNHVFLAFSFLIFIYAVKPSRREFWLYAVLMAIFGPILFFSGTNMYESLQQSFAILLAGIIWKMNTCHNFVKKWRLFIGLLIFFFVLSRPTWAILAIPFYFFALPGIPTWKRITFSLVFGLPSMFISYKAWDAISSPYRLPIPLSDASELVGKSTSLQQAFTMLQSNAAKFFSVPWFSMDWAVYSGALLLIFAFLVIFFLKSPRFKYVRLNGSLIVPPLFHVYILIGILAFLLPFLIIDFRAVRYLGDFLLISLLILIAEKRRYLASVVLLLSVLALPSTLVFYEVAHRNNYFSPFSKNEFDSFREVVDQYILYNPSPNAWCNSLIIETDTQPFIVIPAGIGIASKFEDDNKDLYDVPLKSKYIILDRYMEGANWQFLAETEWGELYLNLDSDCPISPHIYQH